MSITDDLAKRLNAASDNSLGAAIAADPTNEHLKGMEARLRAVAINAQLEAMELVGRHRFTDEDARMAHTIFRGLCTASAAAVHKDDIGLVPSAQATGTVDGRKMEDSTRTGATVPVVPPLTTPQGVLGPNGEVLTAAVAKALIEPATANAQAA